MSHGGYYHIKIKGRLDPQWSDHFEGLAITSEQDETTIAGLLIDQAALQGLLMKICNLGLTLLSVKQVNSHSECLE